jgi:Ca2+-binding EF-hand superfamily protein
VTCACARVCVYEYRPSPTSRRHDLPFSPLSPRFSNRPHTQCTHIAHFCIKQNDRAKRIEELEVKALEVRSKRQYEQLEEQIRARQELESRLLESERQFREEKRVRKGAEEGKKQVLKRLNEATNNRLKAEEGVSGLHRAEEENKETEVAITKLRATIEFLGTELERTKAVAREQSHELANFDDESSNYSRAALEQERVEAASRMDEQLRSLGLQVAKLNEQNVASGRATEADSATIQGMLHDGTKIMNSAHGEVELRKNELKKIDDKLITLLKNLELSQDASHVLRSSFENTAKALEEAKVNDKREDKYMHRRLTHPYLREELGDFEIPMMMMMMKSSTVSSLPPLPTAKPSFTEPLEYRGLEGPAQGRTAMDGGDENQQSTTGVADLTNNEALEAALDSIVPTDPLENLPDYSMPTGTLAEAMAPPPTDGEILVSQSLQLIKDMKDKQAASAVRFNAQAERYMHSLSQLDKELEQHQRHLDDAERGRVNFSEWNEEIPPSPEPGEEIFRKGKPKSHVQGKSIQELFHYYDQDGNGFVNKGELICILSDVGVLGGLDPEDASKAVEVAWPKADENGDGGISYAEFATFINSIGTLKPRPSKPANIPDDFHDGTDDKVWQVYLQHCSKKQPQEMGSPQFLRALRQAGLIDAKCTATAACVVFAKARKELEKRVQFPEFLRAMAMLATLRGSGFKEVMDIFIKKAVLASDSAGNPVVEEAPAAGVIWGAGVGDAEVAVAKPSVSKTNPWKGKSMKAAIAVVGATAQMIEEVARAPVPKNLVSASGKRMSIRELFSEYDVDGSGTLEPAELASLLGDLDVLDGLSPAEASKTIDDEFKLADVNNDGVINFAEFVSFYKALKGMKPSGGFLPVPVPEEYRKHRELKKVFKANSSFAKSSTATDMDGPGFARIMKWSKLLDKETLTTTGIDIIFAKVKQKGKRRITYPEFLDALAMVAAAKSCTYHDVASTILNADSTLQESIRVQESDHLGRSAAPQRSQQEAAAAAPRLSESGMNTQKGLNALRSMHKANMASAAVKQLVQEVALSAVPKNLVSESGKRMSIRELYNKYDRDKNGALEKDELTKLIIDLELVKDLPKADMAQIVSEYFEKADVNGDGEVSFPEFAVFYNDLKGVKRAGTTNLAAAVPKKYKKDAEFKALFVEHCSFGKGNKKIEEMDGAAFARAMKNADLLNDKLSSTGVDIIFAKSKEKSKRKIKYPEFLNALGHVCGYKSCEFDELVDIFIDAGPPKILPRASISSVPRKSIGGLSLASRNSIGAQSLASSLSTPRESAASSHKGGGVSGGGPSAGMKALKSMKALSFASAATKQLVEEVANSIVPKTLLSETGKRMSIRELYNTYDKDDNGSLEQDELKKLIIDLELVKGMTKDVGDSVIESYFKKADVNGDGEVNFQEFAVFYNELKGVKQDGVVMAVPVPKGFKKNAEFKALFVEHCSFGKGNKKIEEMDGAAFARAMKNADLVDGKKLSGTGVDIIFAKSKEKGKRKIAYAEFLNSLSHVCGSLEMSYEDLSAKLTEAGLPKKNVTATPPKKAAGDGLKHKMKLVGMTSGATAQMIEQVANMPVPMGLVNEAGKQMSTRELFSSYDADESGGLEKLELSSFLTDLEALKDLSPKEAAEKIDEQFAKADVDGNGLVSFDEFASFYAELKGLERKGPAPPAAIPKAAKKNPQLNALFTTFAAGRAQKGPVTDMDGPSFSRLCRDGNLINDELTSTSIDIIFARAKEKGKRKIDKEGFLKALSIIAAEKGVTFDELTEGLVSTVLG